VNVGIAMNVLTGKVAILLNGDYGIVELFYPPDSPYIKFPIAKKLTSSRRRVWPAPLTPYPIRIYE
jgi:hypothetical protein